MMPKRFEWSAQRAFFAPIRLISLPFEQIFASLRHFQQEVNKVQKMLLVDLTQGTKGKVSLSIPGFRFKMQNPKYGIPILF